MVLVVLVSLHLRRGTARRPQDIAVLIENVLAQVLLFLILLYLAVGRAPDLGRPVLILLLDDDLELLLLLFRKVAGQELFEGQLEVAIVVEVHLLDQLLAGSYYLHRALKWVPQLMMVAFFLCFLVFPTYVLVRTSVVLTLDPK